LGFVQSVKNLLRHMRTKSIVTYICYTKEAIMKANPAVGQSRRHLMAVPTPDRYGVRAPVSLASLAPATDHFDRDRSFQNGVGNREHRAATDETMTRRALELLASKRSDAYEAALAGLREDTQAWWADVLARDPDELGEDEQPATADVEGLRRFLEDEVLPWFENRRRELANRPLIREQAFGEALDPDKLERLGRYEVHLDRKLAMLLRLKELRRGETSP
jgi:hypothetical protein